MGGIRRRHNRKHRRLGEEIKKEIGRLRTEAPPFDELTGIQKNMARTFVVRNASRLGVIGQLAFVDLHGLGDDYLAKYIERLGRQARDR